MREAATATGQGDRFRTARARSQLRPRWNATAGNPYDPARSRRFTNAHGKSKGTCVHRGVRHRWPATCATRSTSTTWPRQHHGAEVGPLHVVRRHRARGDLYRVESDRIEARLRPVTVRAWSSWRPARSGRPTCCFAAETWQRRYRIGPSHARSRDGAATGIFLTGDSPLSAVVKPSRGPTITAAIYFSSTDSADGQDVCHRGRRYSRASSPTGCRRPRPASPGCGANGSSTAPSSRPSATMRTSPRSCPGSPRAATPPTAGSGSSARGGSSAVAGCRSTGTSPPRARRSRRSSGCTTVSPGRPAASRSCPSAGRGSAISSRPTRSEAATWAPIRQPASSTIAGGSGASPTCTSPTARSSPRRSARTRRARSPRWPSGSRRSRSGGTLMAGQPGPKATDTAPAPPIRRSLILAGGGMKVGYQAGVLQVLLDEAGLAFDHADGTSGGCLNLAHAPVGPVRDAHREQLADHRAVRPHLASSRSVPLPAPVAAAVRPDIRPRSCAAPARVGRRHREDPRAARSTGTYNVFNFTDKLFETHSRARRSPRTSSRPASRLPIWFPAVRDQAARPTSTACTGRTPNLRRGGRPRSRGDLGHLDRVRDARLPARDRTASISTSSRRSPTDGSTKSCADIEAINAAVRAGTDTDPSRDPGPRHPPRDAGATRLPAVLLRRRHEPDRRHGRPRRPRLPRRRRASRSTPSGPARAADRPALRRGRCSGDLGARARRTHGPAPSAGRQGGVRRSASASPITIDDLDRVSGRPGARRRSASGIRRTARRSAAGCASATACSTC